MNSLKSIYSRITSVDKAIEELAKVGVEVRNSFGEIRSVSDILDDLAEKWDSLSAAQQQNLALHIAGRYQLSRFLVLMNQYDQAVQATETALNSAGSGYRENEEYLKSFEAQINQVKNAWTEAVLEMRDNGLGDTMIVTLELGVDLLRVLSEIVNKIGVFPLVFGGATSAFIMLNDHASRFSRALGRDIIGLIDKIPAVSGRASAGLELINTKITSATAKSRAATIAVNGLKTALSTLWPAAAMMAVGFVFEFIIGKIAESRRAMEELKRDIEASTISIQEQKDEVHSLVEEYKQLSQIDGRNIEQEERYLEIQRELAQLLPAIKIGEDAQGRAIVLKADAVERYIKSLEQQIELEEKIALINAPQTIADNAKKLSENEKDLEHYEKLLEDYINRLARKQEKLKDATGISAWLLEGDISGLNDMIEFTQLKIRELQGDTEILRYETEQAIAAIARSFAGLNEIDIDWIARIGAQLGLNTEEDIQRIANSIAELRKELETPFTFSGIENLEQLRAVEEVVQAIRNGGTEYEKYAQILENVGIASSKINEIMGYARYTTEQLTEAQRRYNAEGEQSIPIFNRLGEIVDFHTASTEDNTEALDENTDALNSNTEGKLDNISATEILFGVTEEQIRQLEKAIEIVALLSNQEHLNTQQKQMLQEAIAVLTNMYPHLNGKIEENIGWISNEIYMLSQLNNASGKNATIRIANEAKITDALAQEVRNRIKYTEAEIKAANDAYRYSILARDAYHSGNIEAAKRYTQLASEANRIWSNAVASRRRSVQIQAYYDAGIRTGVIKPPKPSSSSSSKSSKSSASKKEKDAAKAAEEAQRRVLEVIMKQVEAYKHRADSLNDNIALEEYYLAKYEETDAQYRQRQANIAALMKQQADYHLQAIRYMENQLKTNKKLNAEQRRELESTLISTRQTYYGLLKSIDSIHKDIKRSYETIANEVIDVYKTMYRHMQDIALEANRKELDALQRTHNEKMKMLDEELSAYEELIQAKIKQIDQEADEEDFQQELTRKQQERLELIRRINILSMDDSIEARSQVAELREQLSEKEMEIEEFLSNRERELRKASLQQQLEDKRQQIEAERELETSRFEAMREQLELEREQIQQHYENLLNDERAFSNMRQQILNGNIKNMTSQLNDFAKFVRNNMSSIGTSISNNLIDKINDAQKKLQSINKSYQSTISKSKTSSSNSSSSSKSSSTSSSKSSSSKSSGGSLKVGSRVKVAASNAKAYLDAYGSRVRPWADQAKAAGVSYGAGLYLVNVKNGYGALSKTKNVSDAIAWVKLSDLAAFDTGGLTPSFKGGRLAVLHEKELVLNKQDTRNILNTVDIVRSMIAQLPKLNTLNNKLNRENITNSQQNVFNFTIESFNGSEQDARDFFKEINDELVSIGVKFVR